MVDFNEGFNAGDRVRNVHHNAGEEFRFLRPADGPRAKLRMVVEDSSGRERTYLSREMEKL